VTYKAEIDNIENFINICIPDIVIDPIVPKLSTKLWFVKDDKKSTDGNDANIVNKIANTQVPVSVILGNTVVPFKDVANLQVGDVIALDKHEKDKLQLYVDQNVKFLGMPGVSNKKYALKITDVVDKENE